MNTILVHYFCTLLHYTSMTVGGALSSFHFSELCLESFAVSIESVRHLLQGTNAGLHLINLITVRLERDNWKEREKRTRLLFSHYILQSYAGVQEMPHTHHSILALKIVL